MNILIILVVTCSSNYSIKNKYIERKICTSNIYKQTKRHIVVELKRNVIPVINCHRKLNITYLIQSA